MPPSNNMGAENTAPVEIPSENRVLIDWLSWTLKEPDPHAVILACGLERLEFSTAGYGGMGYKQSMRCGNIVVFFDGGADMGCHVSMTGQGCRQYESLYASTTCWVSLVRTLVDLGANITRMDVAIDNVDGALSLNKVERAIRQKKVRTRFKSAQLVENLSLVKEDDKLLGKTLYVGSKQSRIKIRFYDKAAQLGLDCTWVRCELQCMAERAHVAAKWLLADVPLGELAAGALNQYFVPVELTDSNMSRCPPQKWWSEWLGCVSRCRLTMAPLTKYVQHTIDHLKRQYSASVAMIRAHLGMIGFRQFVSELVEDGASRMNRKHKEILRVSRMALDSPF